MTAPSSRKVTVSRGNVQELGANQIAPFSTKRGLFLKSIRSFSEVSEVLGIIIIEILIFFDKLSCFGVFLEKKTLKFWENFLFVNKLRMNKH